MAIKSNFSVSSSVKLYTMPDGTQGVKRPDKGDMFRHNLDPYNFEDWVWDDENDKWFRQTEYKNWSKKEVELEEAVSWHLEKKPKCDCGCWVTHGKDYPVEKHPSYCKLHKKEIFLDFT